MIEDPCGKCRDYVMQMERNLERVCEGDYNALVGLEIILGSAMEEESPVDYSVLSDICAACEWWPGIYNKKIMENALEGCRQIMEAYENNGEEGLAEFVSYLKAWQLSEDIIEYIANETKDIRKDVMRTKLKELGIDEDEFDL